MLAVMVFSQHRVSSSKTAKACAPFDMRHAIRTWSAVGPDDRCFLAAWAVSKSVIAVKHIDETGRCFNSRLSEHKRDIKPMNLAKLKEDGLNKKTELVKHCFKCEYTVGSIL